LAKMAALLPDGPADTPLWLVQLKALGRYCFTNLCLPISSAADSPEDTNLLVSRTGYTGEDGFEFYLQPQQAPNLWRLLIAAGAIPVGLGARDTLRLEVAMPLYGHELSRSITPREAGLDRFMAISKPGFIGREALQAEPSRILIGLSAEGKAIPRADYPVLSGDRVVGHVTSGTYSPTLGKGIAMALVDRSVADNPTLAVEIRGRAEPFTHCTLPFV
jgi:aminomethyltransferase